MGPVTRRRITWRLRVVRDQNGLRHLRPENRA
jgi:hypothetical protein